MSVDVLIQQFGKAIVTSFIDSFLITNPTGIGSNWIQSIKSLTPNTTPGSAQATIGPSSVDSINALIWSQVAGSTPTWRAHALPLPILNSKVSGATQFVQCTMVQAASAATRAGLVVACRPDGFGFTGYAFNNFANSSWQLVKFVQDTQTIMDSGTTGLANGDIYRLSLDQSVGGQATLIVKKNGSLFTSKIDSSTPLVIGWPGLCVTGAVSGAGGTSSDWRTFSCGLGL